MIERRAIFKVPIRPYLKKFYLKSHNLQEPVKVDEDSYLGKQVMSILQDKRSMNGKEANTITEFDTVDLDHTLALELSAEMQKRSPKIGKLIRINTSLQHVFKAGVIVWIQASQRMGSTPYAACRDFLEFYNIDEGEYTADGVHQIWKRHLEDKELKRAKKNQGSVPKSSNRRTDRLRE
jgi:hypothetical protein